MRTIIMPNGLEANMMKTLRIPLDLLAMSQMQRAATAEAGVPLYLPAFETTILADALPADDLTAEADFGTEADGFEQDDDFY